MDQCAPWRELLGLPPYSLPPWSPWSSAGVDGVAKLLSHTHTNRMRRRLERGAKLNLTAAIRTRGARAMMLFEEVNNILYIYYLIHRSFIKTTSRVYRSVVERCQVNYSNTVLTVFILLTVIQPRCSRTEYLTDALARQQLYTSRRSSAGTL